MNKITALTSMFALTNAAQTTKQAQAKTYTVAGVACKNGVYYVRFANDTMRVKQLEKDGQTDVRLIPLPEAMTKVDAVAFLKEVKDADGKLLFGDDNAQQAFYDFETSKTVTHKTERVNTTVRDENGEKLFTFAGVACKNGVYYVRFCNTAGRVNDLLKDGQTDVRIEALERAMTKYDAVMSIMKLELFEDIDAQRAFDDFLHSSTKSVKNATKTIAVVEEKQVDIDKEVVDENDEEDFPEYNDDDDDYNATQFALQHK